MRILALDLGTHTGWALYEGGAITSGTWLLATPKELRAQKKANLDRCCDMRPARLQDHLDKVGPVDVIYFEDVQFCSTQLQAQLWASLRAVVSLRYPGCKIVAVPVGTLKKFATGKGNASKEEMAEALLKKDPAFFGDPERGLFKRGDAIVEVDDNEADALHLLNLAIRQEVTKP